MSFWEGFFAALIAVWSGAYVTFVVMAIRQTPPPPEDYPDDTLLPSAPDDARELVDEPS